LAQSGGCHDSELQQRIMHSYAAVAFNRQDADAQVCVVPLIAESSLRARSAFDPKRPLMDQQKISWFRVGDLIAVVVEAVGDLIDADPTSAAAKRECDTRALSRRSRARGRSIAAYTTAAIPRRARSHPLRLRSILRSLRAPRSALFPVHEIS
jgi:hypothetical protein